MARKDPIAHLARHARLPDTLEREVRALGRAALGPLRALLFDPAAHGTDDAPPDVPAENAALNAALLLATWPGHEADAILLDAFAASPPDSGVQARVSWALGLRGPAVVEPLLAYAGTERGLAALDALAMRARGPDEPPDPRVAALIVALLAQDPEDGAIQAAAYRDPALVEPLNAAFDALFAPAGELGPRAGVLLELLEAAEACGCTDATRTLRVHARLAVDVRDTSREVDRLRTVETFLDDVRRG